MKKEDYNHEDRIKHLEFIQLAINRMSNNSFILKGWNITLIVGLFALSLNKASINYLYLAILPAIAFWGLDAYYLWQERLFRKLYDKIRRIKKEDIEPYSLNIKSVKKYVNNWVITAFSPTIILLHGTVLFFIILSIIIINGGF